MHTVRIERNFESWRENARELLIRRIPPNQIFWDDGTSGPTLFSQTGPLPEQSETGGIRLPRKFVELARWVACHSEPQRWGLLYRLAWRIAVQGQKNLLALEIDDDVRKAQELAKTVRRDRHKMTAFVRFRKTGVHPENGREQFVAWFEPDHYIVELTAPFFQKRFTSIDWSILTPDCCAHWDGNRLKFTEGIPKSEAPSTGDQLEIYWKSYYSHIFNPARLKLKAMQAEMPVKYWKNLPEAPLIADLVKEAGTRMNDMIASGVNESRHHVSQKIPKGITQYARPDEVEPLDVLQRAENLSLREIATLGSTCRACGICERATQAVFGEGPSHADIMIIGEQPGDQEDISGRPFVGPAGQLLNSSLVEAGIDRSEAYVTNSVKGFKWKPSSDGRKRRIHDKANKGEVTKCKPWLLAEILKVKPKTIILLGATASTALLGKGFQLMKNRGLVEDVPIADRVVATVHPSYLLRIPEENTKAREFSRFVADLKLAAA